MRCKHCDYRLWNLTSRTCPECGTPFVPSDFEFAPNSVSFCCPHCGQDYYGTAHNGHLAPPQFDCVRCGNHVHMDDMVLLPTEGYEEEQTQAEQLAWLDRSRNGFLKSWFSTIGMALIRPGRVMQLAPVEGAVGSAWWFAIVTNVIVMCASLVPFFALVGFTGGGPGALGGFAGTCGMGGLFVVVGIAVWGLITHGVLLISGGTRTTIGRTYQGLCFSSGANAVSAIPCVGLYLGWIWWLVSAVIMVKEGQKVGGWRASIAVLLVPILALAGGGVFMVWTMNKAMTAMGSMGSTGVVGETTTLTDAIMEYAEAREYIGPKHALMLVSAGQADAYDFISASSATTGADVPVGSGDLDDFDLMSASERMQAAADAAAALPAGVIAHRVGDFVFTYHGATLNECPGDLWIVVLAEDKSVTPPIAGYSSQLSLVGAGCADGSVSNFPRNALPFELAKQNRTRAKANLPPLPDPFTVTHAKPAVAVSP